MGPKRPQTTSPQRKEEPKPAPAAPKTATAAAAPSGTPSSVPQKQSLGKRKSDCFFILTYLSWSFVAFILFLAQCDDLLPQTVQGSEFAKPVCEALQTLEGPLRPFLESREQWGDKLFKIQPDFALKLVHYVDLIFVGPVAVLLALGFLAGAKFVKNVALLHSAVMLYNMIIVDVHAYEVLSKKDLLDLEKAVLAAFIIYGFLTVFPLVVIKRVWADAPFAKSTTRRGLLLRSITFLGKFALFLWILAAAAGVYEFSVKHTHSMKHLPSVVDNSIEGWEKAGPVREQMLVKAAEFQVFAGQKLMDGAAATQEVITNVGHMVLEKVKAWQAGDSKAGDSKAKGGDSKAKAGDSKKQPAATATKSQSHEE